MRVSHDAVLGLIFTKIDLRLLGRYDTLFFAMVKSGILVVVIGLLGVAQAHLSQRAMNAQVPDVELPLTRTEKWNPKLFEWLSLGQTQTVVDYMLIRFLVEDPAIQHVSRGTHPPSYFHLDLATSMDPAFFDLYSVGSNYLSVIRDDADGAVELLQRGNAFRARLQEFPERLTELYWTNQWQIPMLLAYNYLYELHDLPRASEFFIESAKLPRAPAYLQRLEGKLTKPGGLYEIGIQVIDLQYRGAKERDPDGPLTQEFRTRLTALKLQYFLWQLNQKWQGASPKERKDFSSWLSKNGLNGMDPLGGKLILKGEKIATTTAFERALGLE